MSSVNVGVDADVGAGMRAGFSKYFLSFTTVGFVLPLYFLLLSGFPFFDAVKVVSVVLIQIAAGASIWLNIMNPRSVAAVESVGMGLALGSIFGVVGHQLFLFTPIRSYGWLLPVVVALVVHFFSRKNQITRESFADSELSSLLFVVLAVVVILTQWWWLLPLALPTGLALYLLSATGQRKLSGRVRTVWVVTAVLFIAATFIMLYLRQLNLNWWIRSWDITYFESKSYSIAKFGPSKNIHLLGYSLDYHWFGIAWLGSLTIICNLAPYLSIAQVVPVYTTIVISCLIWSIGNKTTRRGFTKFLILFVFAFVTTAYSPANPTNIISQIWIFAGFIIAKEYFSKHQNKMFAIFGVVAIAAFSGKVSAGFTMLGAFVLTDFWLAISRKTKLLTVILRAATLAIAAILVFYIIIGGPNRIGNNQLRIDFRQLSGFFGVEKERHFLIQIIGSVGTLATLLPLFIPALSTLLAKFEKKEFNLFISFGIIVGLLPPLLIDDEAIGYFLIASSVFASVGLFVLVRPPDSLVGLIQSKRKEFLKIFIFSLMVYFSYDWIKNQSSGQFNSLKGGETPIFLSLQLLYFFIIYILSNFRNRFGLQKHFLKKLQMTAILLLLNVSVFNAIAHTRRIPSIYKEANFKESSTGSTLARSGTDWIRANSEGDAVIATNRFCILRSVEDCIDLKYSLLSATSRRQMFIEAPYYIGFKDPISREYPAWAKERLDLSRGFADKPNAEITAKLREYGVDWFYLFKENTTNRNWEPYGTVMYENTEVAIIKLNDE
jgi:hypothetical protein